MSNKSVPNWLLKLQSFKELLIKLDFIGAYIFLLYVIIRYGWLAFEGLTLDELTIVDYIVIALAPLGVFLAHFRLMSKFEQFLIKNLAKDRANS